MIKIIRKKRLFEDDANAQNNAQAPAPSNTQPAAQPANAPTAQPAQPAAQPVANNQQAPAQPANVPTDNNQQTPVQPHADDKTSQGVAELLKSMENQYWMVANNVPDMIKEKIPDFKPENAAAKPIIDLWTAFKQNPGEQTFNAFIDAFKNFSQAPATDTNNQQAPAQPANPASTTNEGIFAAYNFSKSLNERLYKAMEDTRRQTMIQSYFQN